MMVDQMMEMAQLMDELCHYRESDEMIKIALDMSDFATPEKQLGVGSFGKFYSGYHDGEKEQLKKKLGPIHKDVGFKRFRDPGGDVHQNLQEMLAFIYIAPYISANTDLKTPSYKGELSLSGMILNNTVPTQKMPGVRAHRGYIMMAETGMQDIMFTKRLYDRIYEKLNNIGVAWSDLSTDNFLIDENLVKEYIKSHDQIDDNYDFSKGASLFDFGGFKVQKGTSAGQRLLALKQQLSKIKNNAFAVDIIGAIDELVF